VPAKVARGGRTGRAGVVLHGRVNDRAAAEPRARPTSGGCDLDR
jgi:hypothetical protein